MKRYEVKKDSRQFGCKCDWYKTENLAKVETENPTKVVGKKAWPAAYFVEVVERVHDEMRSFNTWFDARQTVAGPFESKESAEKWAAAHA